MAKHTFRSRYGTVTAENGVLTVAPPLDARGYADPEWVRELDRIAELTTLDVAEEELLSRAVDAAYQAADDLLNAGVVAANEFRDFTPPTRLCVVPPPQKPRGGRK